MISFYVLPKKFFRECKGLSEIRVTSSLKTNMGFLDNFGKNP